MAAPVIFLLIDDAARRDALSVAYRRMLALMAAMVAFVLATSRVAILPARHGGDAYRSAACMQAPPCRCQSILIGDSLRRAGIPAAGNCRHYLP